MIVEGRGSGKAFLSLGELMNMTCECEQNYLLGLSESRLSHFFELFRKLSYSVRSQEKESKYILDFMKDRSTN